MEEREVVFRSFLSTKHITLGMASSRASTSRLSLEDWDALSPLSSTEIASVQKINQAAAIRPLPPHVSLHSIPFACCVAH